MTSPPFNSENRDRRLVPGMIVYGVIFVLVGAAAVVGIVYGLPLLRGEGKSAEKKLAEKKVLPVELVPGKEYAIVVNQVVREALGITGTFTVAAPKEGEGKPLTMPGTLALDPARIRRMRSRFGAEIMEVMQVEEKAPRSAEMIKRDLRPGDTVTGGDKGDVLAIVWSVEVGMRKSDLADAIIQLRLDEQRLKDRSELFRMGNLPKDLLDQTRRDFITDEHTVERAKRNLEVWRVPPDEIKEVEKEAEAAYKRGGNRDREKEKAWARSALVAPISGTIIESNIGGVGEFISDSTLNLFTIADVDRMLVIGYPTAKQLPELVKEMNRVKPNKLYWTITTAGADPIEGPISEISYIFDQNQRSPVVKGYIENPGKRLRSGQYVQASVKMDAPPDIVEIPMDALAEDGRQSFVFVLTDARKHEYTMRRVQVVRRFENTAYVRSELTPEEKKLNLQDDKKHWPPREPLRPGDQILTTGVLELRAAQEDLASKRK